MDQAELTYDQGWTELQRITLVDGKLRLPEGVPDEPGLYRLSFDEETVYYGEAGDLQRRLGDYVMYYATTGIESEYRINKALQDARGANVRIATGPHLQKHSHRCSIESRLIREAKNAGMIVLNGGSIPGRIAFHASEIIRLSAKLAQSAPASGGKRV